MYLLISKYIVINKKIANSKKKYFIQNLIKLKNLKFNPLNTNPGKWSNTIKQFVGKLPMNCLSMFDFFMGLALEGLTFV